MRARCLAALAIAAAALPLALASPAPAAPANPAPVTPIEHVVTLMQENHSFDNYFGTYPGADGIPEGACMPNDPGSADAGCVRPFRIGDRPAEDLGHSQRVFEAQYAAGKMDGFVSAFRQAGVSHADLAMGHYDDRDLPYYWNVADEYVLFDRFFTSAHAGSLRNHMYWVTGTGGPGTGESVPPEGFAMPTIFDRLEAAGVSWKFYVENYDPTVNLRNKGNGDRAAQVVWVPLLNFPRFLDDPRLFAHIAPLDEYFTDLTRGTLPAVSYIVPSGASEHPPGNLRAGEAFVRNLITALMRSSAWDRSMFMWTYDDWGGWYDHVAPPVVDADGYGFRAPALLVSPYAKRGHIDHTTLDFTSILKFIEHNWGLEPLAARDAAAKTFLDAFAFDEPPRPAVFLSSERHPAVPTGSRQNVVYLTYGGALAAAAGVPVVLALAAALRRKRRPAVAS